MRIPDRAKDVWWCVSVLQGLICYKPVEQESCFLRKMDKSDYEHVHSLLQESTQKVSAWQHVSSGVFCFFVFAKRTLWILEKQNTGTEGEACPLSPAKCLFIYLMCKLAFSASSAKLKLVTECRLCTAPWSQMSGEAPRASRASISPLPFPSWLNSSAHLIPSGPLDSARDLLTGDREPGSWSGHNGCSM